MTDGIINESFDILEQELIGRGLNPEGNTTHKMIFSMIGLTRKELIENIKQNINKGFRCACVDTDEIIQLLIGDNQE